MPGLPGVADDIYRWNPVGHSDTSGNAVYYIWENMQGNSVAGVRGIQYLSDIYDTLPADIDDARILPTPLFLHHTHLRWSAPDDTAALMAQSPIWTTQPALQLIGVDVTSMPMSGNGPRQLVRSYHLDYTWNFAHTRAYLSSLQPTTPSRAQQSWGFEGEPPEAVMKDLRMLVRETGLHEDASFNCI